MNPYIEKCERNKVARMLNRMGFLVVVVFATMISACQQTRPQTQSGSAQVTITEADVQQAIAKAVAAQRAKIDQYVKEHRFGQKIPKLAASDIVPFLNAHFSKDQELRVIAAVEQEYNRCKGEVVYPRWIEWRSAEITRTVRKIAEDAQANADTNCFVRAHAQYEKAREVVWRTVVGAAMEGVQVPEVNEGVRERLINLLDTYVNPAEWRIIEREMRAMALDYSVRGEAEVGKKAILDYPEIRTYTSILDDRLLAVQSELIRLGLPVAAIEPLSAAARKAMSQAARLADDSDVEDKKENRTTLDGGYDPNTEKYKSQLNAYHKALVTYGCTKENADRIVRDFTQTLNDMILKLRRNPKYGKSFMKQIVRLGASAINRRMASLRQELIAMIEKEAASRSKFVGEIDVLLGKGDYEAARKLAVSELLRASAGGKDTASQRTFFVSILQTKVNPAIWNSISSEFETKMREFRKGGKTVEGVAWIAAYPNVRTYAEEIDKRYATLVSEAVALGVPEKTAKSLMDEIVLMTAKAENLFDYEDRVINRIVPGKAPDAAQRARFYGELKTCRKTLVENGCTPVNADLLVASIRSRFDAEFDRLGEDQSVQDVVLGANAINRRLKALKVRSSRELIAGCASDAVSAGEYDRARAAIHRIALTGDDEFDAEIYVARVGVLNALINPFQYQSISNEMVRKVGEFCRKGDYKGLKKWSIEYPGVHDDYADVVRSIGALSGVAKELGAESTVVKDYAEKLRKRTDRLFEKRTEKYERLVDAPDIAKLEKSLDEFEKSILSQQFQRDVVRAIREGVGKEVIALLDHDLPPAMTTWEMNERIDAFRMQLLLAIADLEDKIANQEYLEFLAAIDREISYDSQIAMAEDGIRALIVNEDIEFSGIKAVLGEYARVMRLLKLKRKLDRNQLTAMVMGAAYLDQPAVLKRALELGADVNGVSPRDPIGRTALLLSVQFGRMAFVRQLAEAGAFVRVADKLGNTALHYAARRGNLGVVKAMLAKNDVNAVNVAGETALMHAARMNAVASVREILHWRGGEKREIKADVRAVNKVGQSAFDVACVSGSRDVLDLLAGAGAVYGPAQLATAASLDCLGVAQWLVHHGVDVNGENVMSSAVCTTETKAFLVREGGIPVHPCKCRVCEAERVRQRQEAEDAERRKVPAVININVPAVAK